uniref:Ionotropic glutamate receptor C-terminal domain-containing protein n=1 Tax=Strigamia maritima TaxID=126957 RepID=T1JJW4_STRMM
MASIHMACHQFLLLLTSLQFADSAVTTEIDNDNLNSFSAEKKSTPVSMVPVYYERLLCCFYKESCKSMINSVADLQAAITDGTGLKTADVPIEELECGSFLQIMQTVCELSTKGNLESKMFVVTCEMGRQLQLLFQTLNIKFEKHEFFTSCLETNYQKATVRTDTYDTIKFIADMINFLNGNKAIIITDLPTEFLRKQLTALYASAIIVNAADIDQDTINKNKIKYHGAHFFVLCTPKTTQDVLKTVKKEILFSPQYWIILTDMSKEILLENVDIPYNTRIAVAVSTTSKNTAKVLSPNAALLWTSDDKQSATCANLKPESIQNPNTDLDTPIAGKLNLSLDLYEVYSVRTNDLLFNKFGSWYSLNKRLRLETPFPNGLRKLEGITLRVAAIESPPYVIFPKGREKTPETMNGFYGLLFKDLAQEMNFTFTLDIVDVFGLKDEKGNWNGLFQKIRDNEADLGLCDLSVTKERQEIADFSATISSGNLRLVYKIPDEKYHFRLYIVPFGWEIWLLVVASIIVSGVLLYITNRVSPKSALQSTTDPMQLTKIKHQFSMLDCVFAIYNGFNQQGTDLEPREVSGKIIFITVYLSFVIVFASYTSVFTSFLTISDNKKLFETLEEGYADKSYQFGVVKNTNYETVFKDETDKTTIQYKVWQRIAINKDNMVPNVAAGLERAFTHKYALLVAKESASYYLRNNCSFDTSSENIFTDFFHIAYRKQFPYAEAFNEYINRLVEGGVAARLDSQFQRDKINFCESEGVKPLGFKKVVSLYLLLAGASLFAAAALSIEWLFRVSEQASRQKRAIPQSFLVKNLQQNSKPVMQPTSATLNSSYKAYYFS